MKQLIKALFDITTEVKTIPKTGYNKHFKYKFSTVEDVIIGTRSARAKHGIIIIPSHQEIISCENFASKTRFDIQAHYRVMHVSGEELTFSILGSGIDNQDKAYPKALTMALKYAYIQLFNLPRGEDPDQSHSTQPAYDARKDKEFLSWLKSFDGFDNLRNNLLSRGYPDIDLLPKQRINALMMAIDTGAIVIDLSVDR